MRLPCCLAAAVVSFSVSVAKVGAQDSSRNVSPAVLTPGAIVRILHVNADPLTPAIEGRVEHADGEGLRFRIGDVKGRGSALALSLRMRLLDTAWTDSVRAFVSWSEAREVRTRPVQSDAVMRSAGIGALAADDSDAWVVVARPPQTEGRE